MNKKILIGIPMWNQGDTSVGATKPYLEYLKKYGTVILLSPDTFLPEIDLLVLPGGKDVANGNPNDFSYYNSDNERFLEYFDNFTLQKYIESGTRILGICRGFQVLCKYFGIPLIQNIWWDHGDSKDTADLKAHKLHYLKYQDRQKETPACGSWHHQGVSLASVVKNGNFDIIAYEAVSLNIDEDYKIVEYMEHKTLPILAIQTHPERNDNALERFLIKKLLNNG